MPENNLNINNIAFLHSVSPLGTLGNILASIEKVAQNLQRKNTIFTLDIFVGTTSPPSKLCMVSDPMVFRMVFIM